MFPRSAQQFSGFFLPWFLPWLMGGFANAQSFCSSDGQSQPLSLHERFISAECTDCWGAKPSAALRRNSLVIDWIVPSPQGDEAPLSAAATREALGRLEDLMMQPPTFTHEATHTKQKIRQAKVGEKHIRVAHGLPFTNYIGASIAYLPKRALATGKVKDQPAPGPLTAWLVLVETIPPGEDGTQVERNLVRGVLVTPFKTSEMDAKKGTQGFSESRPMTIPSGAQAQRLRIVGWIEDAKGKLHALAQTQCKI